jgi:hypothetical protein
MAKAQVPFCRRRALTSTLVLDMSAALKGELGETIRMREAQLSQMLAIMAVW